MIKLKGLLTRFTVRITTSNYSKLKNESRKTGLSMAYIVDLALNRYWGKK